MRTTDLEVPEEIDLQLEVANAGSRTLAILADLGICGVIVLTVYVVSSVLDLNVNDWFTRVGANAVTIMLFLVIFCAQWLYFFTFEWRWNGQTPGKRLLHLRVIKVDGAPVSWIDVLLRNLSRPVDSFGAHRPHRPAHDLRESARAAPGRPDGAHAGYSRNNRSTGRSSTRPARFPQPTRPRSG